MACVKTVEEAEQMLDNEEEVDWVEEIDTKDPAKKKKKKKKKKKAG